MSTWVSEPELVAVIGKDMASTLCKYRGGIPLYVPKHPRPEHEVAKIVGMPAFEALCNQYGGEHITVPCGGVRKEALVNALKAGKNKRQAARECGVSVRYAFMVAELCKGQPTEEAHNAQLTLFPNSGK